MHRKSVSLILSAILTVSFLVPSTAFADGIIIPDPPICEPGPCPDPMPLTQLAIEYHHVDVRIEGQVVITHVDQVFRNDQDWEIEGTYVFPIPVDAAVDQFTLWMDGEPVEGVVLDRDQARYTYEEIVRRMRDPALLEYADRGAVQASIYPIPPGGERRIELEYVQVLPLQNGLAHYVYPLNTEKFSTLPLEDVRVTIQAATDAQVRAVYSPSHPIDVQQESERTFTASYEARDVTPDTDFELYYSTSSSEIGLNLVTFRDPQSEDSDGYFLLLASPGMPQYQTATVARDVFLILDQSGSMEGEKFQQAQAALTYILEHLNPEDRFNILAFSTGTQSFAEELQPERDVDDGIRWVQSLSARGSTDINRALLETFAQTEPGRTSLIIFLTDGLPTEGVVDRDAILANLRSSAPDQVRLFAFGVGYDVDTLLLDTMTADHHGRSAYVRPGEALDEVISGFYNTISTPVMSNLDLSFGDIQVYDTFPSPLPDLFAGQQLVLMGRYRNSGSTHIQLTGYVSDEKRTMRFDDLVFPAEGGQEHLPRLWATRKIGALLSDIRLSGPNEELVAQVVNLSIRYGIVTPYTSYLVTEENALSGDTQAQIAADAYADMMAMPTAVSGAAAVDRAEAESELSEAVTAPEMVDQRTSLIRQVGARTFTLQNGVWIDTRYDPDRMQPRQIAFLSSGYFDLLERYPGLAAVLALGERVIALADGECIEIIPADAEGDALPRSRETSPNELVNAVSPTMPDRFPWIIIPLVLSGGVVISLMLHWLRR